MVRALLVKVSSAVSCSGKCGVRASSPPLVHLDSPNTCGAHQRKGARTFSTHPALGSNLSRFYMTGVSALRGMPICHKSNIHVTPQCGVSPELRTLENIKNY